MSRVWFAALLLGLLAGCAVLQNSPETYVKSLGGNAYIVGATAGKTLVVGSSQPLSLIAGDCTPPKTALLARYSLLCAAPGEATVNTAGVLTLYLSDQPRN